MHWTCKDSGTLARTITGVCGIRQEVAEQVVAELVESPDKPRQFETQTVLTGKPKLSRTRSTWEVRQRKAGGEWPRTWYELERKERVDG